jgi:CheY-like chemotaxis protein
MTGYRVLGVDDCEDDLFLLKRALDRSRHLSMHATAHDGQEGIDYLLRVSSNGGDVHNLPDLVILDLKMPKLDGFDFLHWMRNQAAVRCPVVVLTSSLSEEDHQRAIALGAEAVLVKPVDRAGYKAIAECLDEWAARRNPHERDDNVSSRS